MRRLASASLLFMMVALLAVALPAAAAPAAQAPVLSGLRVQLASWLALWWPAGAPTWPSAQRSTPLPRVPADCGGMTDPDGHCHPAPRLFCGRTTDPDRRCHLLPPSDCGSMTDPNGRCPH
jgi:hypothetical protein